MGSIAMGERAIIHVTQKSPENGLEGQLSEQEGESLCSPPGEWKRRMCMPFSVA